jgi:diguanylate cyclase (GGDEF)-like protein
VLLPRASLDGARHKAEQIRSSILDLDLTQRYTPLGTISASFGVAISPDHGSDADSLLRAADVALYAAKASGRNRVVVAAAEEMHGTRGEPASAATAGLAPRISA